jgi:hypothetical protein
MQDRDHGGRGAGIQAGLARCATVKYVAATNATHVVQRLVDVVGGPAYTRELPFERMWRDVQAGPIMPMGNLAARRSSAPTRWASRPPPSTADAADAREGPIRTRSRGDWAPARSCRISAARAAAGRWVALGPRAVIMVGGRGGPRTSCALIR